ncbi:hypothetical protein ABZ070_02120 [Streptomyces sp. NPDC006283]|uniref:hypothetical protein n=1 Tax=Streptomyces sp. NPDC006283 TaxID=3156741 RepID=UPI00339EF8E3
MRSTGDTFRPSDRSGLVDGGLARGRRRLARRRAVAVTGSVLALAAVAVTGASMTGVSGSDGGGTDDKAPSVAARPTAPESLGPEGEVTARKMIDTLKQLLPEGEVGQEEGRGIHDGPKGLRSPYASVVFDDGKGAAAVSIGLNAVDPDGRAADEAVSCPSQALVQHDSCTSEKLADGSTYMLFQGYEYPDRREETKSWRATLITPAGVMVEANEWNAPAQKGAQVSRPNPPLTAGQLKTLVTAEAWSAVGAALGEAPKEKPVADPPSGARVDEILASLLPKGLKIVEKQGDAGYGFVVADDGKGGSMLGVNAQSGMQDIAQEVFTGDVTTLQDGTLVMVKKENDPDQKGGAGVVGWTVDTLRPDGFRVVMTALNAPGYGQDAGRSEPVLTIEQMKAVVLDAKWRTAVQ